MDTGTAICLATSYLKNKGYDNTAYISCDHRITDVSEFIRLIKIAISALDKYPDQIALIRLNPTMPSTAKKFVNDWKYLWNASYFIYTNDNMLAQYDKNAKTTLDAVNEALKYSFDTEEFAKHYSSTF